jgi:hypothetical protein
LQNRSETQAAARGGVECYLDTFESQRSANAGGRAWRTLCMSVDMKLSEALNDFDHPQFSIRHVGVD